jgi:CubicO group peptidase (beta-lactamase class C family)
MSKYIPPEEYKETDFLQTFEVKENADLNIRVYMSNSLTNYLHTVEPALSADELIKKGNYRFSFYVDGSLIYTENVHPGAGSPEYKNTKTMFRIPLMSSENEDSWGRFMFNRFLMSGGEDALTAGTHKLMIEIHPYVKTAEVKTGALIAQGEIEVVVTKPEVSEAQILPQAIQPGSGWELSGDKYSIEKIKELNLKIAQNSFKEITGIVVIKNGALLLEEYFNGAGRNTLHDTRSVGKSFAAAVMGIAIGEGYIKNEMETIGNFYDLKKFQNYTPKKDSVTLKSLLTMSPAFEGSDNDESSPGYEENMYPTGNWVKFTLDLPMSREKAIGRDWDYFTAGVVLLGDIINKSVPGGLEKYSAKKLFKPLGITSYKWQYTPQNVPSTAGGLQLKALDLAKFGQLFKNNGLWNGRQVIPEEWISKSLSRQLPLPGAENEYYGYLFWNKTFNVNGTGYEAYYATGNGGNKIFIFKDKPLVVVLTSTAYNKPYAHFQADKIMEKYILPAVLE